MADGARRLEVVIPYLPRQEFLGLHNRTERWGVAVCHRRAGKTVACVNELIKGAISCKRKDPRFAYIAPFYSQAKDVAWGYVRQFCYDIPGAVPYENELRIDLPNGGRIRLYGADNYDRLRGVYFDGIVLDEYGDIDPRAWQEVIRPALSDREGWAIFIGTPKGQNHFAKLWDDAQSDPEWFKLMLRASESGLISAKELDAAKKILTEEQYAAEYECSFDAGIVGSYFGREMLQAATDKRIGNVPWEPLLEVYTFWDLGIGDSTAIWFAQYLGKEIRLIDYLENSGMGLDYYAKELRSKPYVYAEHLLPHDGDVKELGTGKSRLETLQSLNLKATVQIVRKKEDSINAARLAIPQCWFDKTKTARGIDCLRNYRKTWDEKLKVFHDRPLHDWSSHGADAFMELGAFSRKPDEWSKPINYPKVSYV